jgi:hypothetical protein
MSDDYTPYPFFLLAALVLAFSVAVLARRLSRQVRFRLGRVPGDGAPLDELERCEFRAIVRGIRQAQAQGRQR